MGEHETKSASTAEVVGQQGASPPDEETYRIPRAPSSLSEAVGQGTREAPQPAAADAPAAAHALPDAPALVEGAALPSGIALPVVPSLPPETQVVTPETLARFMAQIEHIVQEAKAHGAGPSAAPLWFEAGRIHEMELGNLREAAGHYQEAHQADPAFLPVIHAARRLFAHLGKWSMVLLLIDAELKQAERAAPALWAEKGRICETKLGKPDEAEQHYRHALSLAPSHSLALDALMRHLIAQTDRGEQRFVELVEFLERAVDHTEEPPRQVRYLLEIARMCEAQLGDDDRALQALTRAHALDPARRSVLEALRRLHAKAERHGAWAAVLCQLADLTVADAEAVQYLLEAARVLAQEGQEDDSVEILERARVRSPSDLLVLTALTAVYDKRGMPAQLVEILEAQISATRDDSERVALHAEAGRICDEHLGETGRAIAHFRACIEQEATYQPALAALGRLCARTERWDDLVQVYEIQLAGTAVRAQKTTLLFKLAEILVEKLADQHLAVTKLREALDISPGYVPALKMLTSLFQAEGRWDDLILLYEGELQNQPDAEQAVYLLEKIAEIHEERRGDLDDAIRTYQRMRERLSGHLPALRNLGRLYARTGRWQELIQVNEEEAQLVGDQHLVVALLYRSGELYADKLADTSSAVRAFRQALALMPDYVPALKALGGIYAREARWLDLIAMHQEEIDVARTVEQRAQLRCMVAELYTNQVGDLEAATSCYRDVLEELPAYHPALRALASIYLKTDNHQALVEVYRAELAVLQDPRERGLLRCRVADIVDRHLQQTHAAIDILREAIAEHHDVLPAHERLISLFARQRLGREEAAAREAYLEVQQNREARIANLRALCELYRHRLSDPERALQTYRRLLEQAPHDVPALRGAMACSLLLREYRTAVHLAEVLVTEPIGDAEIASLHLQMAAWREGHIDPPEDALVHYVEVLKHDPANPTALRAVERAYVERAAWSGLSALYELELASATERSHRADLLYKLGDLAERHLGLQSVAIERFEQALETMPAHLPTLLRLKRLYGGTGRPEDELRVLALEAAHAKDRQQAVATLLHVARVQEERFHDNEAATQTLRQVLAQDELPAASYDEVLERLTGLSAHRALGEALIQRAGAVEAHDDKLLFLRRAVPHLERLDEPGAALPAYDAILQLSPEDPGVLEAAAMACEALHRFEDAAQRWEQVVAHTDQADSRARAYARLGRIASEHLHDVNRAVDALQASLAERPDDAPTQELLGEALLAAERPADAMRVYHALSQRVDDAERLRHVETMAELYASAFQDFSSAASLLDSVVPVAVDDEHARMLLQRVATFYEQAADLDGYLRASHRLAAALAEADPGAAARLHARNAKLVLEHRRDPELALRLARQGLELDPGHTELRGFYADLLSSRPNQFLVSVEEHRRICRGGCIRVASVRALYRGWQQGRAHDRAFVAAEVLSALRAASDDESITFAEQKRRVGQDSSAALSPVELTGLIVHPDERNVLHEILMTVAGALHKVEPDDLSIYGSVERKDILRAKNPDVLRVLVDGMCQNLGQVALDVYRVEHQPHVVEAHHAATPVLVVGKNVARSYQTREQKFLLGRKITALCCGHQLLRGLDVGGVKRLMTAIGRAVDKNFPSLDPAGDDDALIKRVASSMSRGIRKTLAEPVDHLATHAPSIDWTRFLAALPLTELRGGLVLANGFELAARLLARERHVELPEGNPEARVAAFEQDRLLLELFNFALSDDYFMARQRLRVAIDA